MQAAKLRQDSLVWRDRWRAAQASPAAPEYRERQGLKRQADNAWKEAERFLELARIQTMEHAQARAVISRLTLQDWLLPCAPCSYWSGWVGLGYHQSNRPAAGIQRALQAKSSVLLRSWPEPRPWSMHRQISQQKPQHPHHTQQ